MREVVVEQQVLDGPVAALVERARLDVEALVPGKHHGDVDAARAQRCIGIGQDALAQRLAVVRHRAEDVHFGGLHRGHRVAPSVAGLCPRLVFGVAADGFAVARQPSVVGGERPGRVRQRDVVRHDDGVGEVREHGESRELLFRLDVLVVRVAAADGRRRRTRLLRLAGAVHAAR